MPWPLPSQFYDSRSPVLTIAAALGTDASCQLRRHFVLWSVSPALASVILRKGLDTGRSWVLFFHLTWGGCQQELVPEQQRFIGSEVPRPPRRRSRLCAEGHWQLPGPGCSHRKNNRGKNNSGQNKCSSGSVVNLTRGSLPKLSMAGTFCFLTEPSLGESQGMSQALWIKGHVVNLKI